MEMNNVRMIVVGDLKHPTFLNLKLSLKDNRLVVIQETDDSYTSRMEILLNAISHMDNNDIIIACLGCEMLCLRPSDLHLLVDQSALCVNSNDDRTCFIMGRKNDIVRLNSHWKIQSKDQSICFKVSRDMKIVVNDDLSINHNNATTKPFFVIFDSVNYHSSIPIVNLFKPNSMFGVYDNYSKVGKQVNGALHVNSMPVNMSSFIPAMWTERAILTSIVFFLLVTIIILLMR